MYTLCNHISHIFNINIPLHKKLTDVFMYKFKGIKESKWQGCIECWLKNGEWSVMLLYMLKHENEGKSLNYCIIEGLQAFSEDSSI